MKPRSQLRYRRLPASEAPTIATVVTLHDDRGGMDDLIPLAQELHPGLRIVSPEAARGVYRGTDRIARTWFGGSLARPEPASFGDSLAQLEQFVLDLHERDDDAEPPWLLGQGQGAVLALSLAAIAPDLLTGVIAVGGCLPTFSQPDLLPLASSVLPILLIEGEGAASCPAGAVAATAAQLRDLGVQVTLTSVEGVQMLGPAMAAEMHQWLVGHLDRSAGLDA